MAVVRGRFTFARAFVHNFVCTGIAVAGKYTGLFS